MSAVQAYASRIFLAGLTAVSIVLFPLSLCGQVKIQFTLMGKFYLNTNSSTRVDAHCSRVPCTLLFCAKTCSTYPMCASFSLNTQNGTCVLHHQLWTATSATYNDDTWKTLNRNKADSLMYHNGMIFTALDNMTSCTQTYKGAWWYKGCHCSNLNGLYLAGSHTTYGDGVEWCSLRGFYYSLKFTEMKFRRTP